MATINKWVAEKTNNKVKDIVPEGTVNDLTRLVLVNAVYFKGKWQQNFSTALTADDKFHMPKKSVKVKMMRIPEGKFLYGENSQLHCQAIELPYVERSLSMFVLLPDKTVTSLSELEKKMTAGDIVNVTQKFQMSSKLVSLRLPRFSLDKQLRLADTLAGMGMHDIFEQGAADLSGIDGSKDLFVSEVLHRAVVEVNEQGTEAAAATAVVTMTHNGVYVPISFYANHPFLFFIQHKTTGSILFIGRLVKPSAA